MVEETATSKTQFQETIESPRKRRWLTVLRSLAEPERLTIILLLSAVSFICFYVNWGLYRSFSLRFTEDHSIFNQVFFNLVTRANFAMTVIEADTFLAIHFTPILVLLAPLYAPFQTPVFLLFVAACAMGATGFLICLIAREVTGSRGAGIVACLLFLCHASTTQIYFTGFRDTLVGLPLISLALLFYVRGSFCPFAVSLVLTCLCKEDMALSVLGFAFVAIVQRRGWNWAVFPLVFSVSYFFAVAGWLMPALRDDHSAVRFAGARFGEFAHLGATPGEIVKTLFLQPLNTWKMFTGTEELGFYRDILEPLAYLPALAPEVLLVPLGAWLLCVLPEPTYFSNIGWYYHAPILPFAMTAVFVALKRIERLEVAARLRWWTKRPGRRYYSIPVGLCVLAVISLSRSDNVVRAIGRRMSSIGAVESPFHQALLQIPKHASVSAQWAFLAYLSSREKIFQFDRVNSADWVVLNPEKDYYPVSAGVYYQTLLSLLRNKEYGAYYFDGQNLILKRAHSDSRNLEVMEAYGLHAPSQNEATRFFTRGAMAVMLGRLLHGEEYIPPKAVGIFSDVSPMRPDSAWIERLRDEGFVVGTLEGKFYPDEIVKRGHLAALLLKAVHGPGYEPPAAGGRFLDAPPGHWAASWMEQFAREDFGGADLRNKAFPDAPVTESEMLEFVQATRRGRSAGLLAGLSASNTAELSALCLASDHLAAAGPASRLAEVNRDIRGLLHGARNDVFGDSVRLIGYRADRKENAGELMLYFYCLSKMSRDYTVWVHGSPQDGSACRPAVPEPWGNYDVAPRIRTSHWLPGAIYEVMTVVPPCPEMRFSIGIWDYVTQKRLFLDREGRRDAVELERVRFVSKKPARIR